MSEKVRGCESNLVPVPPVAGIRTLLCNVDIPASRLLRTRPTFSQSVMVSVGVSALGRTSIHFVEPGVKVNGQYYREILLKRNLLQDIRRCHCQITSYLSKSTLLCNCASCTWHSWNVNEGGSRLHTTNTLATKQSGRWSDRLQSLVGDAGEGLQTPCEGHQWAARTYRRHVGWTRSAHHRYRSRTVGDCGTYHTGVMKRLRQKWDMKVIQKKGKCTTECNMQLTLKKNNRREWSMQQTPKKKTTEKMRYAAHSENKKSKEQKIYSMHSVQTNFADKLYYQSNMQTRKCAMHHWYQQHCLDTLFKRWCAYYSCASHDRATKLVHRASQHLKQKAKANHDCYSLLQLKQVVQELYVKNMKQKIAHDHTLANELYCVSNKVPTFKLSCSLTWRCTWADKPALKTDQYDIVEYSEQNDWHIHTHSTPETNLCWDTESWPICDTL